MNQLLKEYKLSGRRLFAVRNEGVQEKTDTIEKIVRKVINQYKSLNSDNKTKRFLFCLLVFSCLKSQQKLFSQSLLFSVDLLFSIKQYEKKIIVQIYISPVIKLRDGIG